MSNGEPFTTFYVYVYDITNNDPIENALVHLEPRSSGLGYPADAATNASGVATVSVNNSGYYDVEVSHDDYQDDTHLREHISGTTDWDTFFLVP